MVGREAELAALTNRLDDAQQGRGSLVLVSGEAGIGKSRLLEEVTQRAQSRGFRVLSGYSLYESLTPYMPFQEALRSGGLASLFSEESPRLEALYLVASSGLLVRGEVRQETRLDPNIFAAMLSTIGGFMSDSFALLKGEAVQGSLTRFGWGNYAILVERGEHASLCAVLTGRENEFLIDDLRATLESVHRSHGEALRHWDGSDDSVLGVENLLRSLLESEKYEGVDRGESVPRLRRNRLFENVSMGLVRMALATPTLLAIEDLHWADPSTVALLHSVARDARHCGLILVATYRPEDLLPPEGGVHHLVEAMQSMSREDLYEEIKLRRLPEAGTRELLASLLGERDWIPELAQRVHEETEGNPFFVVELVKLLMEDGLLAQENGGWTLARQLGDLEIPTRVYDVLVRRLGRVEAPHRELLDLASVMGEDFRSDALALVLGLSRIDVLKALDRLERRHQLVRSRESGYRFDHVKIKEVLYAEIPKELRREYHGRLAMAIDGLNRPDMSPAVEELAFHHYRSANPRKALPFLLQAAREAAARYSNMEAARFYQEALDLEPEGEKTLEILQSLGDLSVLEGKFETGLVSFSKALDLATDRSKRANLLSEIGRIHLRLGHQEDAMKLSQESLSLVKATNSKEEAAALKSISVVHHDLGDFERSLEYLNRALDIAETIGDLRIAAETLAELGDAYHHLGQYDRAIEHDRRGLNLAEQIGDLIIAQCCLSQIGVVAYEKGDYETAIRNQERTLALCERTGDKKDIAAVLANLGLIHFDLGEFDKALTYHMRALRIIESTGNIGRIGSCMTHIGTVHHAKGEFDEALSYFERSLTVAEELGNKPVTAAQFQRIGMVHADRGNHGKALESLERSLELAKAIGDQPRIIGCLNRIGMLHIACRDYGRALASLEQGRTLAEKLDARWALSQNYCAMAEVFLREGNLDQAWHLCGLGLSVAEQTGRKAHIAVAKRVAGMILSEENRWDESIEAFEASRRMSKEIGAQFELANGSLECGLMRLKKGDLVEARELLAASIDLFRRMKVPDRMALAEEALRRTQTPPIREPGGMRIRWV